MTQCRSKADAMVVIALHAIPMVMLAAAVARWPYSYYMALRVVVAFCGVLVGLTSPSRGWAAAFYLTAAIFNPVVPLHLTRPIWMGLNVAGAALFAAHAVMRLVWRRAAGAAGSRP